MIDIYSIAADQPWAITEEAHQRILEIASREHAVDLEALAAQLGRPLDNTHSVEMRDGTAIIPVKGPIFRYAGLMTQLSGATATGALSTDIHAAMNDPQVRDVVMTFDSPGGAVSGINELSKMIFDYRGKKPLKAYVGTSAASAAYWIASAADEVIAEDSATLGSLGVVAAFRKAPESRSVEIVSSQSPHKREDVSTDAGKARIQALVDELAAIFIDRVAANMGVSSEKVLADFGKGGMMSGRDAVRAGMAHRSGSFEGLIRELKSKRPHRAFSGRMAAAAITPQGARMNEQEILAMQARLNALETDNTSKAAALDAERKRADKAEATAGQVDALTARLTESEKASKLTADALLATTASLAASEDARALTAFTAQAEKDLPFIPGKPEEKGAALKAMYAAMPKEQADAMLTMLKAGNTAVGSQLKAKGSDAPAADGSTARLIAIAGEIEKRGNLKPGSGMERAIKENPALYEAGLAEDRVN